VLEASTGSKTVDFAATAQEAAQAAAHQKDGGWVKSAKLMSRAVEAFEAALGSEHDRAKNARGQQVHHIAAFAHRWQRAARVSAQSAEKEMTSLEKMQQQISAQQAMAAAYCQQHIKSNARRKKDKAPDASRRQKTALEPHLSVTGRRKKDISYPSLP